MVSDERQRREEAQSQREEDRPKELKKEKSRGRHKRSLKKEQWDWHYPRRQAPPRSQPHQVRPPPPELRPRRSHRDAHRDGRVPAPRGGPGLRFSGVDRSPPADPARLRVPLARAGGAAR